MGSYRSKQYTLPDGSNIHVQGYEDHFLSYCFNVLKIPQHDITNKAPRLPYTKGGKLCHYYPDFFMPSLNMLIEIKSAYTLSRTCPLKIAAGNTSTYKYIIIVDKDYKEFYETVNKLHKI